jgi:hypothetical protein
MVGVVRDRIKKERDQREEEYHKNYKPVQLSEAKAIVGTCRDMCPEFERYDREVSQELHPFEMVLFCHLILIGSWLVLKMIRIQEWITIWLLKSIVGLRPETTLKSFQKMSDPLRF